MPEHFSIEELIVDDSFNNYCFRSNEVDVQFWEAYLDANPSEMEKVNEAREMVLGLHIALKELYGKDDSWQHAAGNVKYVHNYKLSSSGRSYKKMIRYAAAIAAILLLVLGASYLFTTSIPAENNRTVADVQKVPEIIFSTVNGERRSFLLPDSTVIKLNSGSTLRLDPGFGKNNRLVYLSGEGLFDVTHNEQLPFIVRIQNYDVKVLGTLFNVRAYPGEKTSETSLVKGKVQIIKDDGGDLTLVPNQKVIFRNISNLSPVLAIDSTHLKTLTTQKIVPLNISPKDGVVLETAWAQNRLEIVNENFESIRLKLERWYNVKIIFVDLEVSRYTFTGTFERENINQVLEAFRFTYPFSYKIEEGKITISK